MLYFKQLATQQSISISCTQCVCKQGRHIYKHRNHFAWMEVWLICMSFFPCIFNSLQCPDVNYIIRKYLNMHLNENPEIPNSGFPLIASGILVLLLTSFHLLQYGRKLSGTL